MTRPLIDGVRGGRARSLSLSPAAWISLIGLVCAAALALPGVTVTTRSLDALFLLIEGLYRDLNGQVPSVDFHTIQGPLAYRVPALGHRLSGSFGGAMPVGMGLCVLLTALVSAHVLTSRLRPYLALLFAGFLLLIVAAPINLGGSVTGLTFASFDSRIGWVAIALLLVMYLRPYAAARRKTALDALSAAALTLAMIYMRAPFGLAALVFLLFMLTDRRQFRWAAISLLVVVATLTVVELFWGGSRTYAGDVWRSIEPDAASGGIAEQILPKAVAHLTDFLLLAVLVCLALWRRWAVRDFVFFLFCAIAGLWLLANTDQRWGIISIHAAAAVAAERLLRQMDRRSGAEPGVFVNPSGVKLFFLAFVLPTILHCALALMLHAGAAAARAGQPLALPRMNGLYLADLWTTGDFRAASAYLETIKEGLSLLETLDRPPGRLATPGSVNIFSVLLALRPLEGDEAGLRWKRRAGGPGDIAPDKLLKTVDTVLLRRTGDAAGGPEQTYLPFLRQNFAQAGEGKHWLLFRRDDPPAESRIEGRTPE